MNQSSVHSKWLLSCGLTLMLAAGSALAGDPLEIVSSDGSYVPVPENGASSGFSGSTGEEGTGARRDAEAEFPASTLSPAERAELRKLRSPVPYYLRNAESKAVAESVIGSDARQRIYPNESGYPERAIGQITFNQDGGSFICTGWLINNNTVATAAHCLHGGPGSNYSTNVRFFPARNGSSNPYGSCTARTLFVPGAWLTFGNDVNDYAAFKLNCNIGATVGSFGIHNLGVINGLSVVITGYPGDKPSGTSWSGSGDVISSSSTKVRYRIDTAGGQSGSPIFEPDRLSSTGCNGACAIGIHAYGVSSGTNSGTRINATVLGFLNSARAAP